MTAAADAARDDPPRLTPLDMARNLIAAVERYARFLDSGPDAELQAYVRGYGERQANAAQLAAQLALVSIAEDVHRVVGVMLDPLPPRIRDDEPPPTGGHP